MMVGDLGNGAMVWWSLPGDITVSRTDWPTRFPQFPLDPEPFGQPLKRALFALEAPAGTKRLVRPLRARNHWAVVIETPSGDDDLSYSTEFTVRLDGEGLEFVKKSGNVSWDYMLEQNYLTELDRVTSTAVADLVLNAVRGTCLAVQARKTGGVYFVPTARADEVQKARTLVQELGGRLYNFAGTFAGGQEDLIHLLVEDLKSAMETVETDLKARHKTDAITKGKLALDRVRFYHEALGVVAEEAGSIEKKINDMVVTALTKGGDAEVS